MAGSLCRIDRQQGKGIEVFSEIPKRYQALKALTESAETSYRNAQYPVERQLGDAFHQSYMAQLVTDAGADYIYKEHPLTAPPPSDWKLPTN